MRRKRPRLQDEHRGYSERISLFQHYATGVGPSVEENDADVQAAQRLPEPGDADWPPELVRLREALARARDELDKQND
jgi:hypothetical protein